MSLKKLNLPDIIILVVIVGAFIFFYLYNLNIEFLTFLLVIVTAVYAYLTYKIIEENKRQAQITYYEKKLEKVYNPLLNSKKDIKILWNSANPDDRTELKKLFSGLKPFTYLIENKELRKKVRLCIACAREWHQNLLGWDEFRQNDIQNIDKTLRNLWEEQIEPKIEEEAQNAINKIESLIR